MKPEIRELITEIEKKHGITIIGVWEVGSTAWGFSNTKSDTDIRFIFRQSDVTYILNSNYKENVDYSKKDIEATGWNIRKFKKMLCSSNPVGLEALNSPIDHMKFKNQDEIQLYIKNYFNIVELWVGYKNWCENMYYKYLENGSKPTVKKNLLTIRCMLNAEFARDLHKYPPLEFEKLVKHSDFKPPINENEIMELINMKRNVQGDKLIGNKFKDEIEQFINTDIGSEFNPDNHVREYSNQMNKNKIIELLSDALESF